MLLTLQSRNLLNHWLFYFQSQIKNLNYFLIVFKCHWLFIILLNFLQLVNLVSFLIFLQFLLFFIRLYFRILIIMTLWFFLFLPWKNPFLTKEVKIFQFLKKILIQYYLYFLLTLLPSIFHLLPNVAFLYVFIIAFLIQTPWKLLLIFNNKYFILAELTKIF